MTIVAGVVGLVPLFGPPVMAAPGDYLLGPQDKLQVRVFDVRAGTGDVHEWTAVTGTFTVGQSGSLSIPLLGEVPAAHQSTALVAQDIATRLQSRIGLTQKPDASVEVVEYRPFYILGAVTKPNAYPYRPGLTVQQAVALAGGFPRQSETTLGALERELTQYKEDQRVLATERLGLLTRQARLDAEIEGNDAVTFPDPVLAHKDDPGIARGMREEQLLLRTSANAIRSKVSSYDNSKTLINQEVATLDDKNASLSHQLALAQTEMASVVSLVSKGLAVAPRQLAAEQATAQYEGSKLDIQLAELRARQDLGRNERDIVDLLNQQQREALVASSDVRARLATLDDRIDNLTRRIADRETRLSQGNGIEGRSRRSAVTFAITRLENGTPQTVSVVETDAVLPDDTLTVVRSGTESGD